MIDERLGSFCDEKINALNHSRLVDQDILLKLLIPLFETHTFAHLGNFSYQTMQQQQQLLTEFSVALAVQLLMLTRIRCFSTP